MRTRKECLLAALFILTALSQILIASTVVSIPWFEATLLATAHSNAIPDDNASTGRPVRLIVHVGPPKTATTSIQCALAAAEKSGRLSKDLAAKIVEVESCRPSVKEARLRFERYKNQFHLNEDDIPKDDESNLATLPKVIKGWSFIPDCISKWNDLSDETSYPDCWGNSYLKYIQTHLAATNHSAFIISNEILAGTFGKLKEQTCKRIFNNILSSLGGRNSTIEIVYTHRMFLDYLISMHSQEFEGDKFTSKPALRKWIDEGGQHTPDLVKYVTQRMRGDFALLSNSIKCLRLASNNNPQVHFRMVDYNGSGNLLETFLRILTGGDGVLASNLIDGAYQRQNMASSKNILIPADRIALVAYTQGLIPTDTTGKVVMSRQEARTAVKEVLDTLNTTQTIIKYRCPHKLYQPLLDQLLERTIRLEQLAFSEREGVKEEISQKFKHSISNKKLCDVDGHGMINDGVFRSLLIEKFKRVKS